MTNANEVSVSIIIPIFNQVQFLYECINSILKQNLKSFEIIVVDDGSTDNVSSLVENQYPFIKLIKHEKNLGLSSALNTGFKNSSGKFLTWISADCYYGANALNNMMETLMSGAVLGLVCGDMRIFGDRKAYWTTDKEFITQEAMLQDNWVRACFMYRREVYEKIGDYDIDLPCVEDWDMWVRISKEFQVKHIINAEVFWRDHSDNLSNSFCKVNGAKYIEKLKEKHSGK